MEGEGVEEVEERERERGGGGVWGERDGRTVQDKALMDRLKSMD